MRSYNVLNVIDIRMDHTHSIIEIKSSNKGEIRIWSQSAVNTHSGTPPNITKSTHISFAMSYYYERFRGGIESVLVDSSFRLCLIVSLSR